MTLAPKQKRKKTSPVVESEILLRSKRRCALCFGLTGDFDIKKGQIAHLDKNPSNSDSINLVYLCIDQHNEYDSTTRQSKGITKAELVSHRDSLYKFVGNLPPMSWKQPKVHRKPYTQRSHPKLTLELYALRLKVYRRAKEFISLIVREANIDNKEAIKYIQDIEEAVFLFDESVDIYLTELYRKAIKFNYLNTMIRRDLHNPLRQNHIEEETNILLWFTDQFIELRKQVQPFLQWK